MTYFRELPNLEYPNIVDPQASLSDYQEFKNIFIRGKVRDDLQNIFTVFQKYTILDGERPDQIAQKLYGDPALDWIVITTANIVNLQDEFPLSSQQLYEYSVSKYGEKDMMTVRYWQTKEVRDSKKRLILPAGLVVDGDFTIPDPNNPNLTINPVIAVSNFDYERMRNDEKSQIYVLKEQYLGQFLSDMDDITTYGFNSEFAETGIRKVATLQGENFRRTTTTKFQ